MKSSYGEDRAGEDDIRLDLEMNPDEPKRKKKKKHKKSKDRRSEKKRTKKESAKEESRGDDLDFSSMALNLDRESSQKKGFQNDVFGIQKRQGAPRTRDKTDRMDSDDDESVEIKNHSTGRSNKGSEKPAPIERIPRNSSTTSGNRRTADMRSLCGYIHYYITRKMHIDLTSRLLYDVFSKTMMLIGAILLQEFGNSCEEDNLWPHLAYGVVVINFAISNFVVLRYYNQREEIKINLLGFYYVWVMMLVVETSHYLALCYIIGHMQCDLLLDWLPMFMTYLLNMLWRGITYVDYIKQNAFYKYLESYIPWNKKSSHEGMSFLFLLIYMVVTLILTTDCSSGVCNVLYYCLIVELALSALNICCLKNFFYLDR